MDYWESELFGRGCRYAAAKRSPFVSDTDGLAAVERRNPPDATCTCNDGLGCNEHSDVSYHTRLHVFKTQTKVPVDEST